MSKLFGKCDYLFCSSKSKHFRESVLIANVKNLLMNTSVCGEEGEMQKGVCDAYSRGWISLERSNKDGFAKFDCYYCISYS